MDRALQDRLIAVRRDLHRHPEAGWTEFFATVLVLEALEEAGIPFVWGRALHSPEHMLGLPDDEVLESAWQRAREATGREDLLLPMRGGFTGCLAEISGALPGKTTVFRVDLDACELEECGADDHLPAREGFASLYPGCMHACGHDAHTAIGLGLARLLWAQRNRLPGRVKILFQPAEEGLRGAASMVQAGLLKDCDRLIGLHVGIKDLQVGTVAAGCRDFLSSTKLDVIFHGKAAHAGICPEQGRNALAAGARATLELLDLPNQFQGLCRVNVGTFHAGSGRNVIPARAHLALETRADTPERNGELQNRAEAVCREAAKAYGCGLELRHMGGAGGADSDEVLVERVIAVLNSLPQVKTVLPTVSFGGGEDVTTMMQAVQAQGGQATELLLGMPLIAPHHSDRFDLPEEIIPLGVEVFAALAMEL